MSNGESNPTEETPKEETTVSFTKETSTEVQSKEGEATPKESEVGTTDYEAFTLPDGWTATDEDMATFSSIAQGMDLNQENAQKLVDLFVATRQGQIETDEAAKEPVDGPEQWQAQLHEHKELGGQNLSKTQANIDLIMKTMPEATLKYFKDSGEHFRPEMISWLNKLGTMLQEDSVQLGGVDPQGDGKTPAQRMFSKSEHV